MGRGGGARISAAEGRGRRKGQLTLLTIKADSGCCAITINMNGKLVSPAAGPGRSPRRSPLNFHRQRGHHRTWRQAWGSLGKPTRQYSLYSSGADFAPTSSTRATVSTRLHPTPPRNSYGSPWNPLPPSGQRDPCDARGVAGRGRSGEPWNVSIVNEQGR